MDERDLAKYRDAYLHLLKENAERPPSDEELATLVAGELDDDARDRVLSRMLKSHEAIEKHKILQELHQQAEERRPQRRRWFQSVGVAAVLVLAFTIWQFAPPEPQDPVQRGRSPENIGRAASSPSSNVALDAAPTVYQWLAEPGARRYRVKVFDDTAQPLWESEWITNTEIPAPAGGELALKSGARYFWIVEIDGSAAARRSLGPYWFRIAQ